jgi:hypothetical protein
VLLFRTGKDRYGKEKGERDSHARGH